MKIQLLPPEVADAIAAGEVIERPASVVKELLENSLDAGAGTITIEIRGAGRNLIRITDDGGGIPGPELEIAFRRHATSKVSQLRDLEAIGTLGFRGEALASIAAVAEVECSSSGQRLRIRAGQVIEGGAAPLLAGTTIQVRDLFANTPARLKFLKSEATEQGAITKAAIAYALCYPDVRFKVTIEGRTALSTSGDGQLRHALAAAHGQRSATEMMAVAWEASDPQVRVAGMVSQPRLSRGNRDGILLAVNRRPVWSRALSFALEDCYRGRLERGRYPLAMLNVSVPAGSIDVNVHPAKREVRFREEGAVFAAVQQAVQAALSESAPYVLPTPGPAGLPGARYRLPPAEDHQLRIESPSAVAAPAQVLAPAAVRAAPLSAEAQPGVLRPVGQVGDGYLVAEGPEGLVLIDQHAAHERILFNLFRRRLEGAEAISQPLLLPLVLDLDPGQQAAAADQRAHLAKLGFEYEDFGPRSIRLRAAPAETPPNRAESSLLEALSILAEGRAQSALEDVAASLACHSAVRFGDRLDPVEQRQLLLQLESAEESITCPHGRPTRLVVSWSELQRHFRRNY